MNNIQRKRNGGLLKKVLSSEMVNIARVQEKPAGEKHRFSCQ